MVGRESQCAKPKAPIYSIENNLASYKEQEMAWSFDHKGMKLGI